MWQDAQDITDADCKHVKRILEDFRIQNLGQNYDLYLQSNTLLLADVYVCVGVYVCVCVCVCISESFQNKCIKNLWTWSSLLSITQIDMAALSKGNNSWTRNTNGCWYVINVWKRYHVEGIKVECVMSYIGMQKLKKYT